MTNATALVQAALNKSTTAADRAAGARLKRQAAAAAARRDLALLAIAKKHLMLETLETQRGGIDFQEQAVWCLKAALEAAFEAGRLQGAAQATGTV